ncbi:MAG: glycosyltransferase family 4 protein [Syntrophotaleaceae bacterium]
MAKVVIIASFAESLIRFRGDLIQEMVKNNHEVIACAPDADKRTLSSLKTLGVNYHNIQLNRTTFNIKSEFCLVLNLINLLRKFKPDVVLTYTIKPNIFGSLASIISGVPRIGVMVTGLGHPFSEEAGNLTRKIATILYKMSITKRHVIFFQNPDDIKLFIENKIIKENTEKILINGSGVCLTKFSSNEPPQSPSFLLIARLIKEKGIIEFVNAAKIVKKKYPNVKFRLVGSCHDDKYHITKDELDGWIKDDLIEYHGYLNDVRKVIESSSVYVLPSFYREGVPRSILEAMAMARPIITTDSPGCRETVVHGLNGLLVPPRDAEALAGAMEQLIENPSLIKKMGLASRAIAEEKYDVKKVNRVILENLGLLPDGDAGLTIKHRFPWKGGEPEFNR